jgi:hypothetical protein
MNTKFAIGCLVQWYEVDVIKEYILSIKDSIDVYGKENVSIDFAIIQNQLLEKFDGTNEEFEELLSRLMKYIILLDNEGYTVNYTCYTDKIYSIADYRREFNDFYSNLVDVLVWGESDMLVPKQMFVALDSLHQSQSITTPKYLATFGICKMWDESWKVLEHTDFSKMPFIENDYTNWWSVKYTMSIDEMNTFNDKVVDVDVHLISPHKFNGCGLIISAEVVKSGVNIPKSVFFVHEDTAFMLMTQKLLGNIPQYHFKNILVVHNRNHPNKRKYIVNEYGKTLNDQRRSNDWYVKANKYSEENCYNIFNPLYKSKSWNHVL